MITIYSAGGASDTSNALDFIASSSVFIAGAGALIATVALWVSVRSWRMARKRVSTFRAGSAEQHRSIPAGREGSETRSDSEILTGAIADLAPEELVDVIASLGTENRVKLNSMLAGMLAEEALRKKPT
jgi:hypothetical protein